MKKLEEDILHLKSEFYLRNNEIFKLNDDVGEKNQRLADLWSLLNQKDEQLGKKNIEYEEQARELSHLKNDVEQKTALINSLNAKISDKNNVISNLYGEIKGIFTNLNGFEVNTVYFFNQKVRILK